MTTTQRGGGRVLIGLCTILFAGSACGGGTAATSPAPASPSPSAVACTSGGQASTDWPAPESRTSTAPPIVSAAVNGDKLTISFDKGTPEFEVTPQSSAHFTATTGQGAPVDLSGNAGVLITLRGFRGDMSNYTGQKDFVANGATLVEVREIGEFEGVIGWAAGLKAPGCAGVAVGASSLTFEFRAGS